MSTADYDDIAVELADTGHCVAARDASANERTVN